MQSGTEIARLILRATVGGTLIAHGIRHGRTLESTAKWFESIGFRQPRVQASTSAVVETLAGSALVFGVATPLAASASIGTMAVAARSVHQRNGFFITADGVEYVTMVAAASAAVAALGGGKFSVDRLIGWKLSRTGAPTAAASLILGLLGAAIQLKTFWVDPDNG